MNVKNLTKIMTLAVLALPAYTYAADMRIENNTKSYATAQTSNSPCSSIIGDQGVLKPGSYIDVPPVVFDMYCPKTCDVQVYMNKYCSGKRVATAKVNHDKGVVSITNHGVGNYRVTGSGFKVTING